jgi:hypothetical protein
MAIGRGSMTKEMFGNRTKKMKFGGSVAPGDGAKKTTSQALHTAATPAMKEGGKVKNTRSPLTINNSPKNIVHTYKTATGAQQYVPGNTAKERRDFLSSQTMNNIGKPAFRTLMAATNAENARNISNIVGPKEAKTDSTVRMYNKMEREWADSANAEKQGSKENSGMKKGGKVQSNFIASAIKKPGSLRKSLGVKNGETIPAATLSAAAKKPGKMGQRARFAETLKKMK